MLKNTHVTKPNTIKISVTGLLLFMAQLLLCVHVSAAEVSHSSTPSYSISQGAFKSELSDNKRKEIMLTNKLINIPDQLNNKATSITRKEMASRHKKQAKKSAKNLISQRNYYNYYADFAIYSAASFLDDDFDNDGFYQTFSVVFDADIYSYTAKQWGEVYALLYLSKNGGPWIHYYTTDNFIIEGESDADQYEVITTFLSGYSTDYYDVLIDLYQVGYNDIVASYSADNDNALYALSLESADYDEPYVDVVEVHGGGSFSLISLLIILGNIFRLYYKN
ncbi:choice-of-anchor H family protein [Colwellia sp. E150_009]